MREELNPQVVALIQEETQRQIRETYDGLYYELALHPEEVWEKESVAERIEVEMLEEMLQVYSEAEQFEKCSKVQGWIDAIQTTKGLLSIKNLLQ